MHKIQPSREIVQITLPCFQKQAAINTTVNGQEYYVAPYLTLPVGWMPVIKQTANAKTTA